MRRFGLIGYPLGHSFSQQYFEEKFRTENIRDCSFDLFPIESVSELPDLISAYPDLLGLSVTIPHKKAVLPYLQSVKLPEGVTACNSIRIRDGFLTGYNTDITGFEKSFGLLLKPHHKKALVLGNGGAAEAVKFVLSTLGLEFDLVSRSLHGSSTLTYEDIGEDIMKSHTVIVNASPLGTFPNTSECPMIPYHLITPEHYLFDLVYNPAKTLFLKKGEEKGADTKNGYDMLAIQAEESWAIWNAEPI